MPDVVRIGQTIYSATSTLFKLDNQPYTGIVAADWEVKRERKIVYAARQDGLPLGITAGKFSVEAFTMKMLIDSFDSLTTYLTTKGLGSYGDPPFAWSCQATEPLGDISAAGLIPITASSPYTWIVGHKDGYEEGVDARLVEVTLASLQMKSNGKQLWSALRSLGAV